MPKQSAERLALAAAHAELVTARRGVAEAEEARSLAFSAFADAEHGTIELGTRIEHLRARKDFGIRELRSEQRAEVEAAQAELKIIEEKAAPYELAWDAAKARVAAAELVVQHAQQDVVAAVQRVVAAEAPPIAHGGLERLREACATILSIGPSLLAMADAKLVAPEVAAEITAIGGGLLFKSRTEWLEFSRLTAASPWHATRRALEADPHAPLPQAPAP